MTDSVWFVDIEELSDEYKFKDPLRITIINGEPVWAVAGNIRGYGKDEKEAVANLKEAAHEYYEYLTLNRESLPQYLSEELKIFENLLISAQK